MEEELLEQIENEDYKSDLQENPSIILLSDKKDKINLENSADKTIEPEKSVNLVFTPEKNEVPQQHPRILK